MLTLIHVRDIAKIHVDAIAQENSDGKRFIVTSEKPHSFVQIAAILKENGYEKSSPKQAPSFLVKLMSLFNREMKGMLPFVDAHITSDISETKQIFNWEPISFEKTIIDSVFIEKKDTVYIDKKQTTKTNNRNKWKPKGLGF